METARETVDRLVRRIVETVDPLRVILFGSRARGDARPDGTHRRNISQRLYREIQDAGVAVDRLVATPSDLLKHGGTPGYVYHQNS